MYEQFYWFFPKFTNWIKTMPAIAISMEKDTYVLIKNLNKKSNSYKFINDIALTLRWLHIEKLY